MPLTGNGTPAGSVPLDALDAEEIAGLLAAPPPWPGRWPASPRPRPPARSAAPDWDGLEDLHIALAIAAADLDDAIAEHTGILHP